MKIKLFCIEKQKKDPLFEPILSHYVKLCRPFASVEIHALFSKEVAKAQERSAEEAKATYSRLFEPHLGKGYDIVLDPLGKAVDSYAFADLLKDRAEVNFYIGGAYGFERRFVAQSNIAVSFGKITLSHKLVKAVLLEQIFRGLSINRNHPYHK